MTVNSGICVDGASQAAAVVVAGVAARGGLGGRRLERDGVEERLGNGMSGPEILTTALAGQWIELHLDDSAVIWCDAVELYAANRELYSKDDA